MKKNLKKSISTLAVAFILAVGIISVAYAASFGNKLNGASSTEVFHFRYDGAAWNYSGSGYKNASFKYTRNGKTLLSKTATIGKVTGSVYDDLLDWSDAATTKFSWNHQR